MLRVALAQINPTVGDLAGNKEKIIQYIAKAREYEVDIVVFPELAVCGYPPEDLLLKDYFVKDNVKALKSLLKETRGLTAVVGFVDQDKEGHLYNAAAVMIDGKLKTIYHKQELPNYGVFDEKRYFKPGRSNARSNMGGYPAAVSICEDIWEGVCQKQAKAGAKLLINISSSPYDMGKLRKRQRLLKGIAKETKAYICYANLVGGQDELVFDGGSLVIDPKGKVIACAREFEEDLIVADLNLGTKKASSQRGPILYCLSSGLRLGIKQISKPSGVLERIYKALVLGTRDYAKKNGFQKVLIGLSGGIDSSLVAVVAVDALGKENVIGVTMPSRYTSEGTRTDARKLADNLGIRFMEMPIEGVFKAYLDTLAEHFCGLTPDITEENIQARIRGNFLMALSNKFGWLVLTTGNKSEVAAGYCTLYGDMSGGFAVIKDVPKTIVYALSRLINKRDKEVIPESIIQRPPTAELRENQKDQDSLPPYEDLDEMLKEYVEEHCSLAKMAGKKDIDLVKKVITLIDRNEYKRRQAPPGIKITPRAFGKDWRLPITNKYKEF